MAFTLPTYVWIGLLAVAMWLPSAIKNMYPEELYWTWDNGADGVSIERISINTSDIWFPPNFIWGVATSAYQVEGNCTNNQWFAFESKQKFDGSGKPAIAGGQKAGAASDHWNRYDLQVGEDIGLMNHLGVNSYRFSIEWSKVEPREGVWDQWAIEHYRSEIDQLVA